MNQTIDKLKNNTELVDRLNGDKDHLNQTLEQLYG